MIDLIAVHFHQIMNSRKTWKLRFRYATQSKEISTKPDLFHVSLMSIIGNDLFYGKLSSTFCMFAQPHQRKAPSTQQSDLLKSKGKSLTESFQLFLG